MQKEIAKIAQRHRNQRVYLLREALDRIDQEIAETQFCIACS